MKKILKAIWQFCSYLFVPQWGRKEGGMLTGLVDKHR